MSAKTNDFKLGLFVLGAVGILIAMLFAFGASRLFQRSAKMETYVATTVSGLNEGAPVLLRGVPVGRVTRINFSWNLYHVRDPRYVVVEFEVDSRVSLAPPGTDLARQVAEEVKKGLRARVESQGLAGAVMLSLEYVDHPADYPALPAPWKPKHIYIPSAPGQLSEIVDALKGTMGKLKEIDFSSIGAAVKKDLEAGGQALQGLGQADLPGIASNVNARVTQVGTIGTNVDALVTQLREFTGQLRDFVGPTGSQPVENLPTLTTNLNQVLSDLRSTLQHLDTRLSNLDLGALNATIENARRASANLEQTTRQLREYPSGVLFGGRPPPARSVLPPERR